MKNLGNLDKDAMNLVNEASDSKILTKCEKCGTLHIENIEQKVYTNVNAEAKHGCVLL